MIEFTPDQLEILYDLLDRERGYLHSSEAIDEATADHSGPEELEELQWRQQNVKGIIKKVLDKVLDEIVVQAKDF